jgi:prepilin-type N-terminal cleavage/methylation domain-containing protein
MKSRGFTILEMIVYLAVLSVVLTCAYPAFEKAIRGSRDIQRNTDDILRAIRAGEIWRKDIRAATGPVHADVNRLAIPQTSGEVIYRFKDGAVWRGSEMVLRDVRSSVMQPDRRSRVTVWRWEVELASPRREPAVRPRFTFEAVP